MAYHYFCAFYDDKDKRWYYESWEDATGRDEGDIYDPDAEDEPWRYPSDDIAPNEEEVNSKAWEVFMSGIKTLPPIELPNQQEPDVIY